MEETAENSKELSHSARQLKEWSELYFCGSYKARKVQ
jgi:hypothetical protein